MSKNQNDFPKMRISVPEDLVKVVKKKLRELNLHRLIDVLDNNERPSSTMIQDSVVLKYESQQFDNGQTVFVLTGRRCLMTKEIAARHIIDQTEQLFHFITSFLVDYSDKEPFQDDWSGLLNFHQTPISKLLP